MTVWHVKNHLIILAVTNETVADSVFELHAVVCKAVDDADVWERKQMKWSHVNWHQKIMKNWLTDISAHKKNDAAAQKTADNMKLLTWDDQHQADFHQKTVCMWLQEKNQKDRKEKKNEKTKTKNLTKMSDSLKFNIKQEKIIKTQQYKISNNIIKYLNIQSIKTFQQLNER